MSVKAYCCQQHFTEQQKGNETLDLVLFDVMNNPEQLRLLA